MTKGKGAQKVYAIKEAFYTLQGEGFHSGRPAVFLRFSGCNLWSGLEKDRETAICKFCDTDFWGIDGQNGGKYTAGDLVKMLESLWPADGEENTRFVVCTGGEPMLQLDEPLIDLLHGARFEIALETNGTLKVPESVDWICVSPKAGTEVQQKEGDELKLVYPQKGISPESVAHWNFTHLFLQPMDGGQTEKNTRACLEYCLKNPRWKLSLQTHKTLGIP